MPFVDFPQKAIGIDVRGRLGLPAQCGYIVPGWSEMGDDNDFVGVYQRRPRRLGTIVGGQVFMQKKENFWMKPAWPVDPATAAQITQRDKMATAVSMWQALTTEQKKLYNDTATRKSRKGYNLFLAQTLKSL